jgi:kinetochore protein Spc7/SPC105
MLDAPTTPTDLDIQVPQSPADQRKAHQRKRRRSSGIPPMNFNNPDDFSSSPEGSIVSEDTETPTVDDDVNSSDLDDDDLIQEEESVNGIDEGDTTSHSIASTHSAGGSSTSSSGRLEKALQQAAAQAGTQGIEYDENGDLTMEMADDEVTNAFQPLVAQRQQAVLPGRLAALHDENINPFSPMFKNSLAKANVEPQDMEQDMTMDFTQAAGGILAPPAPSQQSPKRGRTPKSPASGRRRSSVGRRRSSGGSSAMDETMDLTAAIGGIQHVQPLQQGNYDESVIEEEDLSMEFTSAVGGVLDRHFQGGNHRRNSIDSGLVDQQLIREMGRRMSTASSAMDDDMDMTVAMGGILTSITEHTEPPSEDNTRPMDITQAIGAILPHDLKTDNKTIAKELMEQETDHGQLTRSPFGKTSQESAENKTLSHLAVATSETGSPSLVTAQTRSMRRSAGARTSTTPKAVSRNSTPIKRPVTPSKQITPQPAQRPTTPSKTPPPKSIAMRSASPKRLFKAEIKKAAAETPKASIPALKFSKDIVTGAATPSVVLTPRNRRLSGIAADKEGLGSPKVAALLDRRASIGEVSESFSPMVPKSIAAAGVRFADPRAMLEELEHERARDERRESGRGIMEMEADNQEPEEEKDVTVSLRDKIQSLTPKKNKLKGRKSLAVGAARGLLGKRPVELDEDEDDEDEHLSKRLMNNERSPVKNIKLPPPPSKEDTITLRVGNAPRVSLGATSGNQLQTPTTGSLSPRKFGVTTPKGQGRFKDTELVLSAAKPPVSFNEKLAGTDGSINEPPEEEDRIHLQDFLNMTSIRFMELTTTKRRHTVMPNGGNDDSLRLNPAQRDAGSIADDGPSLEACVVAGICTVPMLELYQHVSATHDSKFTTY